MNIDFTIELRDILAIVISPLLTVLVTRIFSKKTPGSYEQERYEKIVFPVFDKLEPILYKKELSEEDFAKIEECRKIVSANRMIAGGRLLHCFALNERMNFKSMSRKIDLEYDLCTRKLGLPHRPLDYRLNRSRGMSFLLMFLYMSRILTSSALIAALAFFFYRVLLQVL